MWLGSGSPSSIGTVGCVPCGWANCVNEPDDDAAAAAIGCYKKHTGGTTTTTDDSLNDHGIYLVSDGVQATSCKCPDGFTTIVKTDAGDGEPTSSGSSTTGYSTTIDCKWNGTPTP